MDLGEQEGGENLERVKKEKTIIRMLYKDQFLFKSIKKTQKGK